MWNPGPSSAYPAGMRLFAPLVTLLAALSLVACGPEAPPFTPEDAPPVDVAGDASEVTAGDTGTDAGADAVDAAGGDADVVTDTAADVTVDTSTGDTGDPCDRDGDGHRARSCGGDDCDDANPRAHPDADEWCDGVDENCDGVADSHPSAPIGMQADTAAGRTCNGSLPGGMYTRVPPTCVLPGMTSPCGRFEAPMCFACERVGCVGASNDPGRAVTSTRCM